MATLIEGRPMWAMQAMMEATMGVCHEDAGKAWDWTEPRNRAAWFFICKALGGDTHANK